jgi:peroxiredoxin
MRPRPDTRVPGLIVDTVNHGRWQLADAGAADETLVVFYRGLHSPMCRSALAELASLRGEFARRGVQVIAVSSDDAARAARTVVEWNLHALRIGYGLSADTAGQWGVHLRRNDGAMAGGIDVPAQFVEPAVFLVRPDLTLRFACVQTSPLVRLHFIDLLAAVGVEQEIRPAPTVLTAPALAAAAARWRMGSVTRRATFAPAATA